MPTRQEWHRRLFRGMLMSKTAVRPERLIDVFLAE